MCAQFIEKCLINCNDCRPVESGITWLRWSKLFVCALCNWLSIGIKLDVRKFESLCYPKDHVSCRSRKNESAVWSFDHRVERWILHKNTRVILTWKLFVLCEKYILTSKATNLKCRPLKLKSGVKSKPVMKRNVIIIRIEINCFRHVSKNVMFSQMSRIFIWVWLARSVTNDKEQCGWEPILAVYIRTWNLLSQNKLKRTVYLKPWCYFFVLLCRLLATGKQCFNLFTWCALFLNW